MTFYQNQMPSPCSTNERRSRSPDFQHSSAQAKMLKINSLLNPSSIEHRRPYEPPGSPPSTPACTHNSSATSTPQPQTPLTPTPKRQKLIKDNAIFVRGVPKEPVRYLPYECSDDTPNLSDAEKEELARQHQRYRIFPSGVGDQGFIADYQRRIPYSSEKKSFLTKTNRDAFEVFQYTFKVPEDPEGREHVVMWDYQVGLVRITPFFKALKYGKTTPSKALSANEGLKDLSHSITGGALAAQGYWMPFTCARAMCLTFCYPIRWALTPIFGPDFIHDCLRPSNHDYCRYKISPDIVRHAQLEWEGVQSSASTSRTGTPFYGEIPRSVPPPPPPPPPPSQTLAPRRSRTAAPAFKLGSPFEEGSDLDRPRRRRDASPAPEPSPDLSPKTTRGAATGWTSINAPLSSPNNSPATSSLLLTEPHTTTTSWRALSPAPTSADNVHYHHHHRHYQPNNTSTPAPDNTKRRRTRHHSSSSSSSSSSYSSASSSSEHVSRPTKKRLRRHHHRHDDRDESHQKGRSTKYHASDYRAAQWLMNLSKRDAELKGQREERRRLV